MSWLRIDDAFASHPKILALGTTNRRWTWLEVLTYTCRYRSPNVPSNITDVVPRATPSFLKLCSEIGLIDVAEDGSLQVHDWHLYQAGDPKKALRQAKWRKGVDDDVDAPVDADVDASRAGARAFPSRPQPQPLEEPLVLGTSDVDLEAGSSTIAAIQKMVGMPDRSDPVLRLLAVLHDRDENTELVLRSFRLPEAAYHWAREEVLERGGGAGYAVTILKRIEAEGTIATPTKNGDDPDPPRTNLPIVESYERIVAMIRNGVPIDEDYLESEPLTDEQRTELRAMLHEIGSRA